jgi:acetyltransferase-like isoleucine patch superfamily enzyme
MADYQINADEIVLGEGVVIEGGVVLQGRSSTRAKRVVIGDHVFIGRDTRAFVDDLVIGDYTTLNNNALIAGDLPCLIGSCCWFGQHVILNSTGGLTIGNGVGVGAYSQLWTHIRHGDLLQGCRWNSTKPMVIEDDVWFVGHCIVSPIHAHRGSMAMVGSVVTADMEANHTYAGVPAKDLTDRLGPQFREVSVEEKYAAMCNARAEFYAAHAEFGSGSMVVVRSAAEAAALSRETHTVFDVSTRHYNRRRTPEEFAFMKHLLRRLYRFFPVDAAV